MTPKQFLACQTLAAICLLLVPARAGAEIYKWVDEQGRITFSDRPPEGKFAEFEQRPSLPASAPSAVESASAAAPAAAPEPAPAPADAAASPRSAPQVDLYGVSWCPWCRRARDFFSSRGIAISYYDVEKDAAAAARKSQLDSQRGVPFAVVNGVKIHGYSAEAYTRALGSR